MKTFQLDDFPSTTYDKLRYRDTDRQGHVNNAVFSTFLETGRVEIIYNPAQPILAPSASFVIVSLQLNFFQEIKWPGQVDIGTGVTKVGNSSIKLLQHLYQNDQHVASAESVVVQVDDNTNQSMPLTDHAKKILNDWLMPL